MTGFFATVTGCENCFADLMPASGQQDHTTSRPPHATFVKGAIGVHRDPLRIRDDRETPLGLERDAIRLYSCFYPAVKLNFGISEIG